MKVFGTWYSGKKGLDGFSANFLQVIGPSNVSLIRHMMIEQRRVYNEHTLDGLVKIIQKRVVLYLKSLFEKCPQTLQTGTSCASSERDSAFEPRVDDSPTVAKRNRAYFRRRLRT